MPPGKPIKPKVSYQMGFFIDICKFIERHMETDAQKQERIRKQEALIRRVAKVPPKKAEAKNAMLDAKLAEYERRTSANQIV